MLGLSRGFAMKYACPRGRPGEIRVAVHPAGASELELVVGDDGVGLPEGIDPRNTSTLGLTLVRRLAEDQLGGKLEVSRLGGTRFSVRFKQKAGPERAPVEGAGSS